MQVSVSAGFVTGAGNVVLIAYANDGELTGTLYAPEVEFGNVDYPVSYEPLDWVDFLDALRDLIATYADESPSFEFWETVERFVVGSLTPDQIAGGEVPRVAEHFKLLEQSLIVGE